MKVEQTGALTPIIALREERKQQATPAPAAGVAVTLSSRPERSEQVDQEKVAALSLAIEQGVYRVNAENLADKLLSAAQEMLSRRSRLQASIILDSAF